MTYQEPTPQERMMAAQAAIFALEDPQMASELIEVDIEVRKTSDTWALVLDIRDGEIVDVNACYGSNLVEYYPFEPVRLSLENSNYPQSICVILDRGDSVSASVSGTSYSERTNRV